MSNDNSEKKNKKEGKIKKFFRGMKRKVKTVKEVKENTAFGMITGLPFFFFDPTGVLYGTWVASHLGIGGTIGFIKDKSNLNIVKDKSTGRKGAAFLNMNGFVIKGKKEDLKQIRSVQWLISKLSSKYNISQDLPVKMQDEIAKHIEDVQPYIDQVSVFKDGKAVDNFSFVRGYVNPTTSDHMIQFISSRPVKGAFYSTYVVCINSKEINKAKDLKKQSSEFNKMSQKLEALENELEEIKSPKSSSLNKPKRSNNGPK